MTALDAIHIPMALYRFQAQQNKLKVRSSYRLEIQEFLEKEKQPIRKKQAYHILLNNKGYVPCSYYEYTRLDVPI